MKRNERNQEQSFGGENEAISGSRSAFIAGADFLAEPPPKPLRFDSLCSAKVGLPPENGLHNFRLV